MTRWERHRRRSMRLLSPSGSRRRRRLCLVILVYALLMGACMAVFLR